MDLIFENKSLPEIIKLMTARHFLIPVTDLSGPCRQNAIFRARACAMKLVHDECDLSLVKTGRHFGGRDHKTVSNALARAEADPVIATAYQTLKTEFHNLTNPRIAA